MRCLNMKAIKPCNETNNMLTHLVLTNVNLGNRGDKTGSGTQQHTVVATSRTKATARVPGNPVSGCSLMHCPLLAAPHAHSCCNYCMCTNDKALLVVTSLLGRFIRRPRFVVTSTDPVAARIIRGAKLHSLVQNQPNSA